MNERAAIIEQLNMAVKSGECLLCWLTPSQAYPNTKKYGKVHRSVWRIFNGDIPEGVFVCHSCDNRRCINPNHLFLGTALDNMHDKINKGRSGRSGPDKLLQNKCDEVKTLRKEGWTYETIGQLYNVNRRTVARFLAEKNDG